MSGDSPQRGEVVLVAVGGSAGAMLRYGVEGALPSGLGATLAVNVLGSFALGILFFGNRHGELLSGRAMLVVGTGCISSFTTYSTFVVDVATTAPATAAVYVAGSYALGLGAAFVGGQGGRRLSPLDEGERG